MLSWSKMCTETHIQLGVIQQTKGLKGELIALLHQEAAQLPTLKTLFIQIDHTLVPYGVEYVVLKRQKILIKLQGVDSPKSAHNLKGSAIFVLREELPLLSASDDQQLTRMIGYHVADVQEGNLGIVQAIYPLPQQKILAIDYRGKELLIPYHEDIVDCVDHAQQSIIVHLPKDFIAASFWGSCYYFSLKVILPLAVVFLLLKWMYACAYLPWYFACGSSQSHLGYLFSRLKP